MTVIADAVVSQFMRDQIRGPTPLKTMSALPWLWLQKRLASSQDV